MSIRSALARFIDDLDDSSVCTPNGGIGTNILKVLSSAGGMAGLDDLSKKLDIDATIQVTPPKKEAIVLVTPPKKNG